MEVPVTAGALGKLTYLARHDGKSAPVRSRARGFDCRIERKQTRLIGNLIDRGHDLFDGARTLDKRIHHTLVFR